jgi:hypothetical protein
MTQRGSATQTVSTAAFHLGAAAAANAYLTTSTAPAAVPVGTGNCSHSEARIAALDLLPSQVALGPVASSHSQHATLLRKLRMM